MDVEKKYPKFKNDQLVIVHSLGENTPGEFIGIVKGISIDDNYHDGAARIYIVQLPKEELLKIRPDYEYEFATFPQGCLKAVQEISDTKG